MQHHGNITLLNSIPIYQNSYYFRSLDFIQAICINVGVQNMQEMNLKIN